ncbi:hypothetical protein BEP19_14655 [Ammoniphilus oxalaticus]|uniref:Mercuric reductase n=1 Tax=Ammoniphilus oxalaticus TaxID=66863 RepID=A0A419SET7_9BACL|nr:FAD-dependent oxidoreductase [Ammoniphilus oxalaticus]RKD21845.1 hypothetical protein BEP19_14655 [Ammoniphilus oxalaticus]
MSDYYDVIVIGGGAGGLTAASGAAAFGAKTALIHEGPLGGDCLWTGCVPSKALLHTAQLIHSARRAAPFGFTQTTPLDYTKIREHYLKAIRVIQKHDDPARFEGLGVTIFPGKGAFVDDRTVMINGQQQITGDRIIIATGSRPFIPSIPGLQKVGYVTNETFWEMTDLPKRWLALGAGPIGLELGQALRRFGCEVTILERASTILANEEPETVGHLRAALEQEGIHILTNATATYFAKHKQAIQVTLQIEGRVQQLVVDRILVAAGRVANTAGLNLEQAGVEVDEKGRVVVDQQLRTTRKHIYAVGDVNGRMPFTHVAGAEGKAAISHALFHVKSKLDYDTIPTVLYTDPEFVQLGWTEQEARRRGVRCQTYRLSLDQVDRFITDDEANGLLKVVTDHKGKILGAQAVGRGAGDLLQEVVFAKHFNHKIGALSQVIHPYPSRVGAVQQTADLYWREKLFSGRLNQLLKLYARLLRRWRRKGKK